MGLFFPDEREQYTGLRKSGFPRYREVLEGSWKDFLRVGFITLLFYVPLAAGVAFAVLSRSLLAALLSGVVGGAVAGVGYACLVDLIMRRLRDDKGDWWVCWKRALRQNWRDALLPGALQNTYLAVIVFGGALVLWGAAKVTPMTLVLIALSTLIVIMLFTVWWPQIVIFSQTTVIRLKNSLLFMIKYFWKALLSAFLQLVWWALAFLLLPWTAFLVPVLGIWYILFLSLHLVYPELDEALKIEDEIAEKFPGRVNND